MLDVVHPEGKVQVKVYKSYRGCAFTGQMTQPTVIKHKALNPNPKD